METNAAQVETLLFDVDGTLIDSTYVHVDCWWRAFDDVEITVPRVAIHRAIGMDGGMLVDDLLSRYGGGAVAATHGAGGETTAERISRLHEEFYVDSARHLRALPGAREVLVGAARAGYRVVLATASAPREFELARRILDCDSSITAVTTGADVDTAKPDPSVVECALEKVGVAAADAVMIGDATWDAVAAGRAGVRSIAVRTGGIGDAELDAAGFERIVDGVDALAANVDAGRGVAID